MFSREISIQKQLLFFLKRYLDFRLETYLAVWIFCLFGNLISPSVINAMQHEQSPYLFLGFLVGTLMVAGLCAIPAVFLIVNFLISYLTKTSNLQDWCFGAFLLENDFSSLKPIRFAGFGTGESEDEYHYRRYGMLLLSAKTCQKILVQYNWLESDIDSAEIIAFLDGQQKCLMSNDFYNDHCSEKESGKMYFRPTARLLLFDLHCQSARTRIALDGEPE